MVTTSVVNARRMRSGDLSCNRVKDAAFHRGWQEWLAENLLAGVSAERVAEVMVGHGFAVDFVLQQIQRLARNAVFRAGRRLVVKRTKLSTLFEALAEQTRQQGRLRIEAINTPTPREFFERYYFANRPVVLRGLMRGWPALTRWTPAFFAETYGDQEIEITSRRASDPRYEENFPCHRSTIRMDDYARAVARGGETNDYYLVARNQLLGRKAFRALFADFTCPRGFLKQEHLVRHVELWFGPAGTVTPLHHDANNILFAQVVGRKRIRLINPFELERLSNQRECFSNLDLERIDLTRDRRTRDLPIAEVVLSPGEMLFIPIGWWHWVKALDIAISLSFSNFARGSVAWAYRQPFLRFRSSAPRSREANALLPLEMELLSSRAGHLRRLFDADEPGSVEPEPSAAPADPSAIRCRL